MSDIQDELSPEQAAIVRARVRERIHQAATLGREMLHSAAGGMQVLPWRQIDKYAIALAGLDRLIAALDDLS